MAKKKKTKLEDVYKTIVKFAENNEVAFIGSFYDLTRKCEDCDGYIGGPIAFGWKDILSEMVKDMKKLVKKEKNKRDGFIIY